MFRLLFLAFAFFVVITPAKANDVFDRVTQSNTLRCGYYVWPPYLIKDPNTGAMSGFYYELVTELGRILDLKIEWAEEISWSELFAGFETGRIDSYCTPLFELPSYAKATDFTLTIGYEPIHLFVRSDDKRFDGEIEKINDPAVTISVMDGEVSQKIADQKFPDAKKLAAPSNASTTVIAMNVLTNKADVLITNLMLGREFMEANEGKLKLLTPAPIQKLPLAFPVPPDNYRLKRMLDIGLQSLHDNGFIDALGKKYYKNSDEFVRVQSRAK